MRKAIKKFSGSIVGARVKLASGIIGTITSGGYGTSGSFELSSRMAGGKLTIKAQEIIEIGEDVKFRTKAIAKKIGAMFVSMASLARDIS